MSGEPREPAEGASHPESASWPPLEAAGSTEVEPGRTDSSPPPSLASSSSSDEVNALLLESLEEPHPDPFLGAFSKEAPAAAGPAPPVADLTRTPTSESFDAVSALIAFSDPNAVEPVLGPPQAAEAAGGAIGSSDSFESLQALAQRTEQSSSAEAIWALNLKATPPSRTAPASEDDTDQEDDGDDAPRGRSWLVLLLASYSSAVTIGFLWVFLGGRKLRESEPVGVSPPVDTRPDPGRRADRSRKAIPPPPLVLDHLTTLGKPVRLGSLEATPLEIVQGHVDLERDFNEVQYRDGGSGALKLRLLVKNLSTDSIFAPLDEVFIRERDTGMLDSFIQTDTKEQIGMYPLAVSSEWSIPGQEFRDLRPGDSFVAVIVSMPDVDGRLTDAMTWRVRLRTGIGQTDTLGVRFHKSDIKPES